MVCKLRGTGKQGYLGDASTHRRGAGYAGFTSPEIFRSPVDDGGICLGVPWSACRGCSCSPCRLARRVF